MYTVQNRIDDLSVMAADILTDQYDMADRPANTALKQLDEERA